MVFLVAAIATIFYLVRLGKRMRVGVSAPALAGMASLVSTFYFPLAILLGSTILWTTPLLVLMR